MNSIYLVMPLVDDALNKANEKLENAVVDTIVDGLVGKIQNWFVEILNWLSVGFVKDFSPQMETFYSYLGGKDAVLGLSNIFLIIGYSLATLLFIFGLFMAATGPINDVKDEPVVLVVRYIVSLALIYAGRSFCDYLLNITLDIWNVLAYNKEGLLGSSGADTVIGFNPLINMIKNGFFMTLVPGAPIAIVISLVVVFLIVKEFIKLLLEVIERYVVTCIMYLTFPTVAATYVSKNTSTILSSYLRMYISQLFLLVANLFFIKGFFLLLVTANTITMDKYVVFCFFTLAYLKSAQRIDSYMKSMGLNVAQTGGDLLQSAAGALMATSSIARGFKNTTGQAGNALLSMGGAFGSEPMLKSGAMLSAMSRGPLGNMNVPTMDSSITDALLKGNGKIGNPSDGMIRGFASGSNTKIASALNSEGTKSLFNGVFGGNSALQGINMSTLSANERTGEFSAMVAMGNDKEGALSLSRNSSMGGEAIEDNYGNKWFASFDAPNIDEGESFAITQGEIESDNLTSALGLNLDDYNDGEDAFVGHITESNGGFEIYDNRDNYLGYVDDQKNSSYVGQFDTEDTYSKRENYNLFTKNFSDDFEKKYGVNMEQLKLDRKNYSSDAKQGQIKLYDDNNLFYIKNIASNRLSSSERKRGKIFSRKNVGSYLVERKVSKKNNNE